MFPISARQPALAACRALLQGAANGGSEGHINYLSP